jgi:hypothetical protein
MFDASPLQILAQGTCNGVHGALVFTATGATVTSPGGGGTAGTYVLTLDPGLPGAIAVDAAHARVFVQVIGGAANSNAQVAKTSSTTFTVTTQVGVVAPADIAFDFIIWKDPEN